MAGMFSDKPLKVSVRTADERKAQEPLAFRWESDDGSDAAAIESLVRADPARWAVPDADGAAALVAAARGSEAYLRMLSQFAEKDERPVAYAMLVQLRVGARTYPLLLGASAAADAPADAAARLVANVTGTARSGFYSAFFALEPALETVREACGAAPTTAQELEIELPDELVGKGLAAFELVRNGLDDCRGAVVLDPAVQAALR